MAVAFENCDVILSEKHAEHINFRHEEINEKRASKFKTSLNLTATLPYQGKQGFQSWRMNLE